MLCCAMLCYVMLYYNLSHAASRASSGGCAWPRRARRGRGCAAAGGWYGYIEYVDT